MPVHRRAQDIGQVKVDIGKEFESITEQFPYLNIVGERTIAGDVQVGNLDNPLHLFKSEIILDAGYPFRYPTVFETGGDIPRTVQRHVFPKTGNLCLGVEAEQRILCVKGIGLDWFMNRILVPRYADEYLVMKGEDYQQEYSHNFDGNWEFYFNRFRTTDPRVVKLIFQMGLSNGMPNGKVECLCGSKKKFGKCHRKEVFKLQDNIRQIGEHFWRQEYENLMKFSYDGGSFG